MMRAAQVIAKLQAELVPDTLRSVGGGGALAGIKDVLQFSGTAFVIPKSDKVSPNATGSLFISQRVVRGVSVYLGFTRQKMRKGGEEIDAIEDVSEAVKACLIGWVPDGETNPVTFAGAGIAQADYDQGFVLWACDFECPYTLRKAADET